jgi:hypothetical protein
MMCKIDFVKVRNLNYIFRKKKRMINRGGVCCVPAFQNTEKKNRYLIEILIMYLACVFANNKEPLIREN